MTKKPADLLLVSVNDYNQITLNDITKVSTETVQKAEQYLGDKGKRFLKLAREQNYSVPQQFALAMSTETTHRVGQILIFLSEK